MTTTVEDLVEQAQKERTVAGVTFQGTRQGKLTEGDIDTDDFESHYLFPGDSKDDSTYPVVDADGYLRRGNVESAYSVGARGGVSEDELHKKLKKLNDEFDNPPIDFDDGDENARSKALDSAVDGEEHFERAVQFVKAGDAEKQIAIGAVLVPDRVDHQGDFFREETVRSLAEDFDQRVEERDAVPGVMHAVFPDHIELADNRVTEGRIELGERTLPAGTWMQAWKFNDDELWSLIEDGIIGGYSIGGTISNDTVRYDAGEHPDDVSFPEEVKESLEAAGYEPEEVSIREITDGRILEVSAVDYPAVPDATHEAYKSASSASLAKGDPALTGSIVEARLYLEERGHSEEEARRLANYLQREKSRDKSGGWIQRAKEFFSGDQPDKKGVPDLDKSDQADRDSDQVQRDQDPAESDGDGDADAQSKANTRSAMQMHDAALDQLEIEGVDHGRTKFADDDSVDFGAAKNSDQTTEAEPSTDGSDSGFIESMSNDKADQIIENLEQLNKRLADDGGDGSEETVENAEEEEENGGSDGSEKSGDGENDGSDGSDDLQQKVDDLQKTVSTLADTVDKGLQADDDGTDELEQKLDQMEANQKQMAEIVTQMANAQGVSQQADLGKSADETEETFSEKNSPFTPKSQQAAGNNGGVF